MKRPLLTASTVGLLVVVGCAEKQVGVEHPSGEFALQATMRTVRFQIGGFEESKSGAT